MDKIKILIVDDEELIRERFVKAFPFDKYGYTVIGEADNGEVALNKCAELQPDIVLTDIIMPLMDGLELLENIKKIYPQIYVIMLSCHDQFKFAQKALSLGASDYLLKEDTQFSDLLSSLEKIKTEITNERIYPKVIGNTISQFNSRGLLLKSIFKGEPIDEAEFRNLGIYKKLNCIGILLIRIQNLKELSKSGFINDMDNVRTSLIKKIERAHYDNFTAYGFLWEEYSIGLITVFNDNLLIVDINSTKDIINIINQKGIHAQMGVSMLSQCFEEVQFGRMLKEPLNQAFIALSRHFYEQYDDKVIYYNNSYKSLTNLSKALKIQLTEEFMTIGSNTTVINMQKAVHENIIETIKVLNVFPNDVTAWIADLIRDKFKFKNETYTQMLAELDDCYTIKSCETLLIKIMLCDKSEKQSETLYSTYVNKALNYINAHYNEQISLTDVSKALHISPNYLSHIFKNETGENFTNYITKIRIDFAKAYLAETEDKVYIIAENIGINDCHYFNKQFKKLTGLTPGEYRQQKKER